MSDSTLELVAVVGAATGVLGVVLAFGALLTLRRMRRAYTVLQAGDDGTSFVTAVDRQVAAVDALRSDVGRLQGDVDALAADLRAAIRHVAVVRYDAFQDMGGRMSFSAALLDDAGDGVVLTAINGRAETRSYAKGVRAGRSEQSLSPEEQQAVDTATQSAPAQGRR